jgi:hypothetical protein
MFTLKIDTNRDVFGDTLQDEAREPAHCLRAVAMQLDAGTDEGTHPIIGADGTRIGGFTVA